MKLLTILLAILLCSTLNCVASDINFGSTARSISLGGAGLALGDEFHSTTSLNPAAPAVYGARFRFIWPGLDLKATGASAGKVWDSVNNLSGGNASDALSLANEFASKKTTLSLTSVAGFAGTAGLVMTAQAIGSLNPSEDVKRFATANLKFDGTSFNPIALVNQLNNINLTSAVNRWQDYGTSGLASDRVAAEASFDAYLTDLSTTKVQTSFVWGPTLQFSSKMPFVSGDLWVGTNVSILNSESHSWILQARDPDFNYNNNNISLANVGFRAVATPRERKTGLKADFGMIYRPEESFWQYGLVVNNFIKPKLGGISNAEGDAMISVGVAAKPINGFVFAADLINLTNSNNEDLALRLGAEYQLGRVFALRIGHSGDTLTYGARLFGFDLAFSNNSPNLLSNVLRF